MEAEVAVQMDAAILVRGVAMTLAPAIASQIALGAVAMTVVDTPDPINHIQATCIGLIGNKFPMRSIPSKFYAGRKTFMVEI